MCNERIQRFALAIHPHIVSQSKKVKTPQEENARIYNKKKNFFFDLQQQ